MMPANNKDISVSVNAPSSTQVSVLSTQVSVLKNSEQHGSRSSSADEASLSLISELKRSISEKEVVIQNASAQIVQVQSALAPKREELQVTRSCTWARVV